MSMSQLGSSLRTTSSQIETFTKLNPADASKKELKAITSSAKDIGDKMAKLAHGSSKAHVDPKLINKMVANINKIIKHAPEEPPKELGKMMDALSYLQAQLKQYKAREGSHGPKITKQAIPGSNGSTQNVIAKILEDVKYLHKNIGVIVQAGTAGRQASSFKNTLKKIRDRLIALKKLNKTRGEIAAQIEQDTQR